MSINAKIILFLLPFMRYQFVKKIFSKQLRKPSGYLGKMIGDFMTWGNRKAVNWAIEVMQPRAGEHILEIGFGPGYGLEKVAKLIEPGVVAGIDFSREMVALAKNRNQDLISKGRMELQHGEASQMPYQDNAFDAVFATNVVYFWPRPEIEIREILRVLKPGGRVIFYMSSEDTLAKLPLLLGEVFITLHAEKVLETMKVVGFSEAECCDKTFDFNGMKLLNHCLVGVK